MSIIQKAPETMSAKERVRKTFALEKTDRVTIGYSANDGIHARFAHALGIPASDHEGMLEAIGADYRGIGARYAGPNLFTVPEGRRVNQIEGSVMRWIAHESGGYWDYCDFPLANADDEQFATFPIPDPDLFDYEEALAKAKSYDGQYGLYVGHAGAPDIINSNGRIMGMEDILCHLATGNEAVLAFVRRRADSQLKWLERTLDKCRGLIDFMWLGEDLGTQIAPMISPGLYRKILKPIHKNFVDLAGAYGIPAMMHTCGSSSWVYEDLIEIGLRGVDTLQPEATNMSPRYLQDHFGGRLSFRGCISTAGPLAYGSVQEVEQNCRETLAIMMANRGYHFAPSHAIQDNSPVENVIAMYNAAHRYGRY